MRAIEFITESVLLEVNATLRFGDIKVTVDEHAIEQVYFREINHRDVDKVLRKLQSVKDQLMQMEPSSKIWVKDPDTNISIGLRKDNAGPNFTLKTVFQNRTFDSETPEITTP